MAKAPKRAFVCNECGADYPRWQGQCSACHAWNTITEMRIAASPQVARNERLSGYAGNAGVSKVQKLSDISLEALPRFSTGFKEFDRVLGGGVVPGSAILIGGNPGAGKSTLLLQTLCKLAEKYEIPTAQTVAIGDGANDLPMIKAAGLGIAYHAKPKVNEQAEVTIRHADLMGVFCILSGSMNQK